MKHIEFLGIPGSGKSTLCESLVTSLQEGGYQAYDIKSAAYLGIARWARLPSFNHRSDTLSIINRRIVKFLRKRTGVENLYLRQFLVQNPGLSATIFQGISEHGPTENRKQLYVDWFCKTISRYALAQQHLTDGEILLFDEGFVNRSITLFHYRGDFSEADIREYANRIPVPDSVILPEVPLEIARARMESRDKGFPPAYADVSGETLLGILEKNVGIIETMADELEERGAGIHRIDNTRDLVTVRTELNQIVRESSLGQ